MGATVGHPLRSDDPRSVHGYQLLGRLGDGGMGVVYAARAAGSEVVALKTLRHLSGASTPDRERFVREMRAASSVDSPHVAAVLGFHRDVDPPYLVTEFVDGLDVRENVTTDGPLPPDAVTELALSTARGLAALHARDVAHRDLTWRNVVIGASGAVIVDLGIARWRDEPRSTTTGVAGSEGWLPPEAWDDGDVDPRAGDVFQWGLLVAHAATGLHPFVSRDAPGSDPQLAIVTGRSPVLDGLPVALRDDVAAALSGEPDDRPSAPVLVQRLTARSPSAAATRLVEPPAGAPVGGRPRPAPGRPAAARPDVAARGRRPAPVTTRLVTPSLLDARDVEPPWPPAEHPPAQVEVRHEPITVTLPASRRGSWGRRGLFAGATMLAFVLVLVALALLGRGA